MRERIRLAARIRYRKVMATKILTTIGHVLNAILVFGFLAIIGVGVLVLIYHAIR